MSEGLSKLIDELGWEIESVDAICNVTQTSDYINHPNAFVLHDKLNLKTDCLVLDLYHGCPGWVVGLSTIASMMALGTIKRALFVDGDNITSLQYPLDRESRPLFGDCGTATALEYDENAPRMYFDIGANSKDGVALIRQRGGVRFPHTMETFEKN